MTSRTRASRNRRPPTPTALELADGFIADFHAGDAPEQKETIRSLVLAAGELIAEKGWPGVWDALDHAELLARMPAATPREHAELCLYLVGFTTWLAAGSFVDPDRPLDAATAVLATGTSNPILLALCHHILSVPDAP